MNTVSRCAFPTTSLIRHWIVLILVLVSQGTHSFGAEAASLRDVLTADEFRKAGLSKLTEEELAFLSSRLLGQLAAPEQKGTQSQASAAGIAPGSIEAVEKNVVRDASVMEAAVAVSKLPKGNAAFGHEEKLQAAVVKIQKVPTEMRSRIVGPFEGWSGRTLFKLENGQVWQQAEAASFAMYADSPLVIIRKGMLGVFYLNVEGHGSKVKVKRVD
jgi:hypothetical protein